MKTPHLDFYKKCMLSGSLPCAGLCNNISWLDFITLELFEPTENDRRVLIKENLRVTYWASGAKATDVSDLCLTGFTPLRQTIVLFMAAINNEL